MMETPRTFGGWVIWLVVVLAICAVVWIATTAFGLPIPPWLLKICGVLVVAFVVIVAIKLLLGMGGSDPKTPPV